MEDKETYQTVISILLENECPDLKLEDGALKVFINTKGKNREDFSEEFLDFMEYIGKTTDETVGNIDSGRIRRIHERVRQIRRSEKAGVRLMQRWEELAYEREEGRVMGISEAVLQLLKMIEPVKDGLRERILAERDIGVLENWLRIAARAESVKEFEEKMMG